MNKSTKLSKAISSLMVLLVIGFLTMVGCNKNETFQPKVSDFFVSECNDITPQRDGEFNDTIYVTTVDETKLKISTTNTLFNCCSESFHQKINLQGQNVSILLSDEGPTCNCVCGHHVNLTIENLKEGQTYTINIKKDGDYFNFEVTFGPNINLMFIREQ